MRDSTICYHGHMDVNLPPVTTEFVEAKAKKRKKPRDRTMADKLMVRAVNDSITMNPAEMRKFVLSRDLQQAFKRALAVMVEQGDPEGMRIAANLIPKETPQQIRADIIEETGAKNFAELKIAVEAWHDISGLDSQARIDLCIQGLEAEFIADPGRRQDVVKRLGGVIAPEPVERT